MLAAQLAQVAEARRLLKSGRGRAIRIAAGLSCAEIGEATGVSAASVARWERGLVAPRGEAALRYAAVIEELTRP